VVVDKVEIARKNRKRGKESEKAIAKMLGGSRKGLFGGEDIDLDGKYSLEIKSRNSFSGVKWMDQCVKNSKGKFPVVIIHVTGKQHINDYVLIRIADFKTLIGKE
jgi:hypothetical protein